MSKRATIVVFTMVFAACSAPAETTVTESTLPSPDTSAPTPSTTTPSVEIVRQSCASPPVTFSPLCEIYELLEAWHVDGVPDPQVLGQAALTGLAAFETDATEPPPRSLFCAIPDPAFGPLCEAIALRVESESLPVGPAVEAAMMNMIDSTLDPFTYYLPPGQTGAFRLNGIVGGIGVLLDARDAAGSKCAEVSPTCQLEVVVVLEDNAGLDAGLAVGDVITSVDGEPVAGKGFTAIVSAIAGDESGVVSLGVERDGTSLVFDIERMALTIPTVEYDEPLPGVGYLRIPDFESDIPFLLQDALSASGPVPSTLVVDLRDNPGGLIDSVLAVADEFVDSGVVMTTTSPGEVFDYEANPGGLALDGRIVVLVNQGTASAAEVLTGMLRDRRGAIVVGTNTFGKDAVQIPFDLRNGGAFYVAVARWSTPAGDTAAGDGLSPDHLVEWPSGADVTEIVEIALEAAS